MDAARARLGHVPTRADIDARGALAGSGLELAWADDPVALFFLHVQGSGRLVLGDGKVLAVGYAATNGLPYVSIASVMTRRGLFAPGLATAPAIRAWLLAHPRERDGILASNPRYVFFRERTSGAPTGSLGVELTAGRSVASDDEAIPRGALAWLRTTRPVLDEHGEVKDRAPMARFVFAQDSGAAIRGPARIDLFVGSGEAAGLVAGNTNESGDLWLLLCR
jgi:membrane-bound lytic murein transglycosylase A